MLLSVSDRKCVGFSPILLCKNRFGFRTELAKSKKSILLGNYYWDPYWPPTRTIGYKGRFRFKVIHRLTLRQGRGVNREPPLKLKRSKTYLCFKFLFQMLVNDLQTRHHHSFSGILLLCEPLILIQFLPIILSWWQVNR